MHGDPDWLDVPNERIDTVLERMEHVEKYMDGMMCGNYITTEQRDRLEKVWINIRSIYYPCVLDE